MEHYMTQKSKVVTALKTGKTLSVKVASHQLGVSLRTVERAVHALRARGNTVAVGTNTMGTRTYTMTPATRKFR
jgi:biotin operon repressor